MLKPKTITKNLKLLFLFIVAILLLLIAIPQSLVRATHCAATDYDCQISEIQQEIDALSPAHENNKQELANLKKQLDSLNKRISGISNQLKTVEVEITGREEDLAYTREILFEKVKTDYIRKRLYDVVSSFLSKEDAARSIKEILYQQIVADEDRKTIDELVENLIALRDDKKVLGKNKESLAAAKRQVDEQVKFLGGEVSKVEGYLSELSSKQSQLLALKAGSFSVSVGDAALGADYEASLAGWNSSAPSGSVTIFSFGAYAGNGANYRRNGMSQYGAWARAKSGQDYNQILQAYYNVTPIKIDSPATISTDQGVLPFEKHYLYGIAEMPSSWTENNSAALKAQAIAARTFAYRYGGTICTSDSCQAFLATKVTDPDAQTWRDAVDATEGLVLPEGVSAQYVSTPGGYLDTKGWDTKCGNQSCLASEAWDVESPWFYKAWYKHYKYGQGFSTCKRSNPWLSQEDMADVLNAWVVFQNGDSGDLSRILPPDGCGGGSPYSINEMKNRANQLGGEYTSISSVNVLQSTSGYTSQVVFQTNKGSLSVSGFDTGCAHRSEFCDDFWTIFNLRAPGYISIKNRMFDIRVK